MRIVFVGPPGSGKGTQCKRLVDILRIPHLSTGEMLRQTKQARSALARQISRYIDAGQLAPDYLVMRIIKYRFRQPDCETGCLLDGFPRTIPQAQQLDELLDSLGWRIDLVFYLHAEKDELVRRLLHRSRLESRADDTKETIDARLRVYETATAPLLDYYQSHGVLRRIDAMVDPDAVFAQVRHCLKQLSC